MLVTQNLISRIRSGILGIDLVGCAHPAHPTVASGQMRFELWYLHGTLVRSWTTLAPPWHVSSACCFSDALLWNLFFFRAWRWTGLGNHLVVLDYPLVVSWTTVLWLVFTCRLIQTLMTLCSNALCYPLSIQLVLL